MDTLSPFETLSPLPVPLTRSQCVFYKQEILVLGGWKQINCYSYHVLKNQYKFICSYPKNFTLTGHSVIKLTKSDNNSNYITLLSFGGQGENEKKHTLIMKYISVWDDNIKIKKIEDFNKWMPFVNNDNRRVFIGREKDNYHGIRAIITGQHSHLLFITYPPKNIDVFNLNTFRYVNHSILPTDDYIWYHCFELKKGDNLTAKYESVLFCKATGLLIEYDENENKFKFQKLPVFADLLPFYRYAYIQICDSILFFGGWNDYIGFKSIVSKAVCQYSMDENKWIKFDHTLPISLNDCIGVLNDDKTHIHILGGEDGNCDVTSTHVKTKVLEWIDTIEKEVLESDKNNKKRIYESKSPLILLTGSMKYRRRPYLKCVKQDLILLQNLFQTKFGYQVFTTYNPRYPITQLLSLRKLDTFISKRYLNLTDTSNDNKNIYDGLIFVWCGYGKSQDDTLMITSDNKRKCLKEIQDVFVRQTNYFVNKPKIFITITYSDEKKGNEDMATEFRIPLKSMIGDLGYERRKQSNFTEIFCQMIEKNMNKSLNVIVKHVADTIFDGKFKKDISVTYSDIHLIPQLCGNDNTKGTVVLIKPLGFKRYWSNEWIRANVEAAKRMEKMIKANGQGLIIVVKNTSEWENTIFPNLIKLNDYTFSLSKFFNNRVSKILYEEYGIYVIERKSVILDDINIDGNVYVVNCEIKCQQNIKITSQLFVTKNAILDRQLRQSILPIQWDTKMNHDIPVQLQDLEDKGKKLMNDNLLDDSILLFEQHLQLSLNTFGADHPFVAGSYYMIGDVYYGKKNYKQAILYYEKTLQIMFDNVTTNDYVAILCHSLGLSYSRIKQYDKSIEYYEKGLNITLKLFGDNFPDIIDWHSKLANAYSNAKRFGKAIEYYVKIVKIRLHKYGASQSDIADAYDDLGRAYHRKKMYNKAIFYYEKALQMYLDIFGVKNATVVNLYENFARAYTSKRQYDKAIECFEKAIEIMLSIFGGKHEDITDTYIDLGNAYEKKGANDKAIFYYKKALQMRLDIYGNNNLDVAIAYDNLANCYMCDRQYDNAIKQYEISMKIKFDIVEISHSSIADSYCGLGCVYSNKGDYTKSKQYFEKELDIRKNASEGDHNSVANVYINLGITCRNAREFDNAIQYYEEALKIRVTNFGANHSSVAECYTQFGCLYDDKKQFDKAFTSFEKALNIRLEIFGPNDEAVADSYYDLGDTCNKKELYDKAINYHEKALHIRLHIFGINHNDVVNSYHSLGVAYYNKGDHNKSIEYYEKAIQIKKTISKKVNITIGYWCWDLGSTLNTVGERKKASEYYKESWKVFNVILGEWNTTTLRSKEKVKELTE
ncbi:hypothetical protein RFI_20013 [Reticulomyxa filosa]|uniref:Uncharacterized protein n=1 Tax=Reticulomyxa filosa TaxID=46433 RepID=X6MV27_RETFI|nr:hypothetical protein RFI_20013 [Reticulomyxa filosa]|eukprot:ETO17312.1 hypothetical protein RFI_20013 [Reticulomyxa filosa]